MFTLQQENYGSNTFTHMLLIKTFLEGSQVLDLLDKDFKSAITNVFKELKEKIMSKELKESMTMMLHQI